MVSALIAGVTFLGPPGPSPRAPRPPPTRPKPGWGQGGGHPTLPAWGAPPASAGAPGSRRPSRWLAGVVAGVVLLASGYGISQALDKDTPAGAGVPTAAPIAAAPVPSGEEPAAAVAKAPEHPRSVAGVIDRLACLRLRLTGGR
jgi:hypothetical protein